MQTKLVVVGTPLLIARPHRAVRARLRIRLPPWMIGEEAFLPGTARHPPGFQNPAPYRRQIGRQSHSPWPVSCAKLPPINRT